MKTIVLLSITVALLATTTEDFLDKGRCDRIINKQLYSICYSDKNKAALGGWVTLYGNKVNQVNIKKRPRFYSEKNIPMEYRAKYKDYTGYGKRWNRGHFIVADADFDYNKNALSKAYTMANIIPQSAKMNQRTWTKVEKYGRTLAYKFGYINSVSIADYRGATKTIGNNIVIANGIYRIYYNDEVKFKKCFYYKNSIVIDVKNDKLKNHIVGCQNIKY